MIKTLKTNAKNVKSVCFFLKYMYFSVYTQFFFLSSISHLHFRLQTGIATSLSVIEQYFFCSSQINVLALCTQNFVTLDEKLWPRQSCKVYLFFAEKAIFHYAAFKCCRDHNNSSWITKFCVYNSNTYTYSQKNILLQHTQGGGNFNLKSGLIFRRVYILSNFNVFNVLNGLVLVLLTDLKVTDSKILQINNNRIYFWGSD